MCEQKVFKDEVMDFTYKIKFHSFGRQHKTTCLLTLKNGFSIMGESSLCSNNICAQEESALDDARNKAASYMQFLDMHNLYLHKLSLEGENVNKVSKELNESYITEEELDEFFGDINKDLLS